MRRRMYLFVVVLLLLTVLPVGLAAADGDGAVVDRAADCWFFHPFYPQYFAGPLMVQSVRNPNGDGQFHCHGTINDVLNAPPEAAVISGPGCTLPYYFPGEVGWGHAVITPSGHINMTCSFSK